MKTKGIFTFLMFAGLLLSAFANAHESFRTVGVIDRLILEEGELNYIQVRNQNDQSVQLWISGATEISEGAAAVDKSSLQVGTTVVIDSHGDEYNFSEALTIRIVPAIESE